MILGIILIVLGVILFILAAKVLFPDNVDALWVGLCVGALIYCGGLFISSHNIIRPMDVYEGKTTLKYTIIDSVKVDSTVVWKPEYKK